MEDQLLVQDRQIVVPGEELAKGMGFLPSKGTYRDNESIRAGRLGLASVDGKVIKLVPLAGNYLPKAGDVIITRVFDVPMSGWRLDTATPYSAMLPVKDATSDFIPRGADLSQYFTIGDYLVVKITNVTSQMLIDVSLKGPGLRKLDGGRILKVNANKVPRIIGKQGSMVSMIKQATDCKIIVGQNGLIWITGEPSQELIAVEAIKTIEAKSHLSGLTDTIKTFLEEKTGKQVEVGQRTNNANNNHHHGNSYHGGHSNHMRR